MEELDCFKDPIGYVIDYCGDPRPDHLQRMFVNEDLYANTRTWLSLLRSARQELARLKALEKENRG